jgi:hypothetical protein
MNAFTHLTSHKDILAVSGVDAAGRQQQAQVFPNTDRGHRRLVAWLQAQPGVVPGSRQGAGMSGSRASV